MASETERLTSCDTTIVVVNWNRVTDTLDCLASLCTAKLDGAGVLVVDNGSRDGSVARIRDRFPDIQTIGLEKNRGFAGGSNAGIQAALAAGAGAVLLLNNDVRVAPDFLPPLIEAMNACEMSGAVCAAVRRMERPELLDVAFAEVRFGERHTVQVRGVNALPSEFDRRREVEVAPGCCVLLSGKALRHVGLFDETFFAYHEDVDWCLRARKAGYRLFFEPLSRVFHKGGASTPPIWAPPAEERRPTEPQLPNAEPLPWNPLRAYLGTRNLVRLMARHADREARRRFARACGRELPLELLAASMGRSGWLRLGRFSYGDAVKFYLVQRHPLVAGRGPAVLRRLLLLILAPLDLLWMLPRDLIRAYRRGVLTEWVETVRGLRDGYLGRPLPLDRLGLR